MLDFVDLKEWKTKKTILAELEKCGMKTDERVWRTFVENYNKKYCDHIHDTYIVHSNKGYKLTDDKEEITKSIEDGKKRGLNLLWKYSRTMKALGQKDNIRMDLEEMGVL